MKVESVRLPLEEKHRFTARQGEGSWWYFAHGLIKAGVDETTVFQVMTDIWREGSKVVGKRFKEYLGLGNDLLDIVLAIESFMDTCEFKCTIDASEDSAMITVDRCPDWDFINQLSLPKGVCEGPCAALMKSFGEAFNAEISVHPLELRPRGDKTCKFIWKTVKEGGSLCNMM